MKLALSSLLVALFPALVSAADPASLAIPFEKYVLPENGDDKQSPHAQDEVYYIISGEATLKVDGKDRAVKPGSVVFVKRGVAHRFHSIEKELHVLVFFSAAKAED